MGSPRPSETTDNLLVRPVGTLPSVASMSPALITTLCYRACVYCATDRLISLLALDVDCGITSHPRACVYCATDQLISLLAVDVDCGITSHPRACVYCATDQLTSLLAVDVDCGITSH